MRGSELRNHSVKDAIILPDGRVIHMMFCFESFAITEEIYNDIFHRDVDIIGIIDDLSEELDSAIQAFIYGAVAVADKGISFRLFLEDIYNDANKQLLYILAVKRLRKMLRDSKSDPDELDDAEADVEFQWDTYYRMALSLGFTDADFWASTPRKIWLLSRDKETDGRQEWLTKNYV